MELFQKNGCLTEEGLDALIAGQLDELGRLEAAEHLAYCNCCLDRYTARLEAQPLETAPPKVQRTVMSSIYASCITPMDAWRWPELPPCWR